MSDFRATSLQPAGGRWAINVSATASGMRLRKVWWRVKRSASDDGTKAPFRLLFTFGCVHEGHRAAIDRRRDCAHGAAWYAGVAVCQVTARSKGIPKPEIKVARAIPVVTT